MNIGKFKSIEEVYSKVEAKEQRRSVIIRKDNSTSQEMSSERSALITVRALATTLDLSESIPTVTKMIILSTIVRISTQSGNIS